MLQAYGGDIKGNVWRFDLSNADASQWRAEKIATLKDATNKPQPITTGVRIEIDQNNNVDRYLFVGTGKLLDQQDLVDTSVINSFYVIRDGTWTTPEPAPAVPYSRANLTAVTGTSVAGLGGVPIGRGWYQDGTDGSLKINSDVYADVNVAVYGFSKPSTDPCLGVLSSTLYARDLTTGNSLLIGEQREHRRQHRHRGRHRGRRADSGGPRDGPCHAARAGSGDDDERAGRERRGQYRRRRDRQAPRDMGARQSVAGARSALHAGRERRRRTARRHRSGSRSPGDWSHWRAPSPQ